jgi:hypothetical protein
MLEVQLLPLVSNLELPVAAPATTRSPVPSGYGIQEHCLPFTAATALGFLIKSPISFGWCALGDVPRDGLAFRSPLARNPLDGQAFVFYVKDDRGCSFVGNAFTLNLLDETSARKETRVEPGLSFFDREDQLDLFKLHLPYIWRTPREVDALFLPLLNRSSSGLTVLSGIVETDWYAHQVNLVLRQPAAGQAIHVAKSEPIAQVIFVSRPHRRPALKVLPQHARVARELRADTVTFGEQLAADHSVYKTLARSQHGRIQGDAHTQEGQPPKAPAPVHDRRS